MSFVSAFCTFSFLGCWEHIQKVWLTCHLSLLRSFLLPYTILILPNVSWKLLSKVIYMFLS